LDDINRVEYQGQGYSLSKLAATLAGCTVSGFQYFRYEGTLLGDIGKTVTASSTGSSIPVSEDDGECDAGVEGDELSQSEVGHDQAPPVAPNPLLDDIDPLAGDVVVGEDVLPPPPPLPPRDEFEFL
jgi:hypothetical protein